jgi:hypothetical protein
VVSWLEFDQCGVGKIRKDVRETLNPKSSGKSVKRRRSKELFPTPEGPETTSGRKKSTVVRDMKGFLVT